MPLARPITASVSRFVLVRVLSFGLGIILALLGVVVLFSAFKQERKGGDPIGKIPWRPLLCVVGAIVFFGFFLPRLGFVISFPIMIVLTAAGSNELPGRTRCSMRRS